MNPPSVGGALKAPAAGAPKAGDGVPNAGAGVAPNAEAAGAAPKAGVGLGVRKPELGGPLPNPPVAGAPNAGAPNAGAPNVVVGGGRLLPNAGAAGVAWLPKAGAGLEDRKPFGAGAGAPKPLVPLEPKPLEAAGVAPNPLWAVDPPKPNAGWLAAGAGALAVGAWLDEPKENAGAAGAVEAELPNAVAGAAVDEAPKPPVEPDPKPLDEVDPKVVDAGVCPNEDPDDDPNVEAGAGWVDDEPNVNAGVGAGLDGACTVGGVDFPVGGGVAVPKPKAGADDVTGAPKAGALLSAGVFELWPKVKPGVDAAGVDAAGVDVAGADVAGAGLAEGAPKENAGALDSGAGWPNPVLGFGSAEDVVVDDDPNVKPVVDFVSVAFSTEVFAPKLNDGAVLSFGFSLDVELLGVPNENDGVTLAESLAGTWGGFDAAPKEKAGFGVSGFESDPTDDGAKRFLGRSDSVGFDSETAPKLKPLGFGASVAVVVPKLNDGAELVFGSSSTDALRLPFPEVSVVLGLGAPNENPLEAVAVLVAVAVGVGAEAAAGTPNEKDGVAVFSAVAAFAEASSVFLAGAEKLNEIGASAATVTSDEAGAPKLKPPVVGVSDVGAGVGAVKLNPPDVIPAAGLSASFFVSAAGVPKLKPADDIDPVGFSASFFESAAGAPKLNPPDVIDPAADLSASFFALAEGAPKLKPLAEIDPAALGAAEAAALGTDEPAGFAVSQQGHLALEASFTTLHPGHFHCPGLSCMNLARGFTAPLTDAVVLDFSATLGAAASLATAFGFSGSFAVNGFDTHSVVFVLGDEGIKSNGAAPA